MRKGRDEMEGMRWNHGASEAELGRKGPRMGEEGSVRTEGEGEDSPAE